MMAGPAAAVESPWHRNRPLQRPPGGQSKSDFSDSRPPAGPALGAPRFASNLCCHARRSAAGPGGARAAVPGLTRSTDVIMPS